MALHEAELWANKSWVLIPIADGLQYAGRKMRCPECGGAVRPHKGESQQPHFEHHERNVGCSKGDYFDGTPRRHKKPLE